MFTRVGSILTRYFYIKLWLVNLLHVHTGTNALNVARDMTASNTCNKNYAYKNLFDANYLNSEWIGHCEDLVYSYIVVDLQDKYSVQYVVLYAGSRSFERHLKHFKVNFKESQTSSLCSEYPFEMAEIGHGMRVNCAVDVGLQDKVQIESHFKEGMDVAELEVHTLATKLPYTRHVLLYRGCFENFYGEVESLEFFECQQKCVKEGFVFAGFKAKESCACKNNLNSTEELPEGKCNHKCDEGIQYCGGEEAYSVYIVNPPLPYYVGCFPGVVDYKSSAAITGIVTVAKCLYRCNDYHYAKLQDGDYCICGDYLPPVSSRMRSMLCSKKCTGDQSTTCGGKSNAAIFSTCKQGREDSIKCSELFQCATQSSYDLYGVCNACNQHYVGDYCFERVTSQTRLFTLSTRAATVSGNATFPKFEDNDNLEIIIISLGPLVLILLIGFIVYFLTTGDSTNRRKLTAIIPGFARVTKVFSKLTWHKSPSKLQNYGSPQQN